MSSATTSLNLERNTPRVTPQASGDARLSGWRLIVARILVIGVSAVTIGLGVYALVLWPRLATPCEDATNTCLFTPEQAISMRHLGITPLALALGVVVINCIAIALANGVAALLLWRRADDAMALLVATTLILLPAFFTPMYMPLTGVWHQVASIINRLGGLSFLLLLGLFPTGRFEPRWIVVPLLAMMVLGSGIAVAPGVVVSPIVLGGFLSIIGAQVYRYRSKLTEVQRQQTKWAIAGLILALVANQLFWQPAGWIPALDAKDSLYPLLLYPDFALLISIIAVTFGVAILRYRLYDIDVIIRQTLIYSVLTAILAALYFGIVIGAQTLIQRLTGATEQPPVVIVATTLLIAMLVTPLRSRIQVAIDRAFYRSKFDAERTLRDFGGRMRTETNLGQLCEDFVIVVQQTMQPEHVHLWLRDAASARERPVEEPQRPVASEQNEIASPTTSREASH